MRDNIEFKPNDPTKIAAREVLYSGDITKLQVAALATVTGPDDAKSVQDIGQDNPLPIRQAPIDIWTVSFAGVGAGLLAPEMLQRAAGAGVAVSQAAGNLVIGTGTGANAEFLARSNRSFNGALLARHQLIASQRIANTNLAVMLADRVVENAEVQVNSATSISVVFPGHGFDATNIGQSMFVGAIQGIPGAVPGRYAIADVAGDLITFTVAGWPASGTGTCDLFGWNFVRALYTGTSPTVAAVDAQRRGWASGDTSATINTTASPGHMMQMGLDGRQVYFADALLASSATPNLTTRASRYQNMPDDDVQLFFYVWSFNGATAPASNTNWTIGFLSVEDTVNAPIYLAGMRPMGQGAPMPVAIIGNVVFAATQAFVPSVGPSRFADTITPLGANASFTGTSRDESVTVTFNAFIATAFSDQAGTLIIENSTDNIAWVEVSRVAVPAGEGRVLEVPAFARYYRVRYVNGAVAQASFALRSLWRRI